MKVIHSIAEMQSLRRNLTGTVGFTPTMGSLHEGHLTLMREAKKQTQNQIVSIYVNPKQFNDQNDFANYPQVLAKDVELIQQHDLSEIVFAPLTSEIYPKDDFFSVLENHYSLPCEGEHRPGHFNGMLTIVLKLFQIVRPTHAFFGLKDYQQYVLVQKMIDSFFLDIELVGCETVRETSGLAKSSRNARLSPPAQEQANRFYQILTKSSDKANVSRELQKAGFEVDYVEDFLERRVAAVRLDGVRLLDNVAL